MTLFRSFRKPLHLLAAAMLIATSGAAAAEEQPVPPWFQPDVLRAAVAINLSDEQKPQFQEAISDFFNDRMEMINKEVRRNPPNLERRIHSRTNSLVKAMDEKMGTFLTPEQMPQYEVYRDTLLANLKSAL
ncbi:MAG: hypothetical protein R3E86_14845 [Pseudomonadales bacterium]